jgi:tRNA A-37 threonylcarbamoyl transferase component Bud32
MAIVEVNPHYHHLLQQLKLVHVDQFLALPGVIVSGHPDRHVVRVTLEAGDTCLTAYIKREHRRPWRDALANAWMGFGFISKSRREARMLRNLRRAGVGCPEWIAAGEDNQGRAFLLVKALTDACELRLFLRDHLPFTSESLTQEAAGWPERDARRRFARVLGEALAHLHEAGFDHPDLHAKHIFVNPDDQSVHFLDCQRTRQRRHLDWHRRWHNLAALDATLAEALASSRDRLTCLRAYLRTCLASRVRGALVIDAARRVRNQARRLQRRRYIREMQRDPLPHGAQELIWLDGEALCVTPEFRATWPGPPSWLSAADLPTGRTSGVVRSSVRLPVAKPAALIRRRHSQPLRWLWAWLRRRPLTSPEVHQAAILFRLQRYGVGAPRLLAFGQRHPLPWRTESFLLTETPAEATDLRQWLADRLRQGTWTAERKQRWQLLRQAAAALRGIHAANCYLRSRPTADPGDSPWLVQPRPRGGPAVTLCSTEVVRTARRSDPFLARRDLITLRDLVAPTACTRSDQLRFLLCYLRLARLTPTAKDLIRSVVKR